jgi:hypothetical protein
MPQICRHTPGHFRHAAAMPPLLTLSIRLAASLMLVHQLSADAADSDAIS